MDVEVYDADSQSRQDIYSSNYRLYIHTYDKKYRRKEVQMAGVYKLLGLFFGGGGGKKREED